jgi:hypothetical protein
MTPQPVIAETKYADGKDHRVRLKDRIVEAHILWDERTDVVVRVYGMSREAFRLGQSNATRFDLMAKDCERLAAQIVALPQLLAEVEGLRAFKASVDAALNSGDGSYRP